MTHQPEAHSTRHVLRKPHWPIGNIEYGRTHLLPVSVYRKLTEHRRLKLPSRPVEAFGPPAGEIELPVMYPLSGAKDTPLHDMLVLLNLARGRKARRILEIGTFRARTTYALHLNCPGAAIVSYDIEILDSPFRGELLKTANVQLRNASFAASAETLRKEPRFDFIFVDASHRFEHVIEDSRLALELVDPNGIILWHDYRANDFPFDEGMRVPEALNIISEKTPIYAIPDTYLAAHAPNAKNQEQRLFTQVPDADSVSAVPGWLKAYRKTKHWFKTDLLAVSVYRRLFFERRRLKLASRPAEVFGPPAGKIKLPAFYPLFMEQDTPLNDLLVVLNLAKGRKARRILEVGTYHARTTYALYLNCPEASIVSYDIQTLDSPYRRALHSADNVQFVQASFSASASELRKEPPFDLIIVNGSHRLGDVIADSKLALERLSKEGIIIWHGYCLNNYYTKEFRVPEALDIIRQSLPVFTVDGGMCFDTTCAVHMPSFSSHS
jgi:predicted O-methyltransferase YrrM